MVATPKLPRVPGGLLCMTRGLHRSRESAMKTKFLVIVFPDEAKAATGVRALNDLHAQGSLTLYALSVVTRESDGKLSVKESVGSGPIGMTTGALVGGLLGLLGGPVGAAVGLAGGAVLGGWHDLFHLGVSSDFVRTIAGKLTPDTTAVIADVDEDWVAPTDVRMQEIGGTVMRETRTDFEDEQLARQATIRRAELTQLKEEFQHATGAARRAVEARLAEIRTKLKEIADQAEARQNNLEQETRARITALEEQAATAKADAKARLEKRIAETRAERAERGAKLRHAWELTKEALRP
ncbi:DUF1269 domain-containing protein [Microvirga sp. M2]|uniref:DUF1269 domain-containing protein n=1 Tax=Microvirga sp. M2 TaxID=3073270 RepID=UPI0039C1B080